MAGQDIRIDKSGFNAALERMISQSKRSAQDVVYEQAKGVISNVLKVTPPAKSTKESLGAARKIGKARVASDILKVLQGVPVKAAEVDSIDGIKSAHRVERSGGQVKGSRTKIKVPKTMLNAYIKTQQLKVGRLAAGWNAAAARFGVNVPSWISAHSTSSAVKIIATSTRFGMKATNKSPYAGKISNLESKISHAIYVQAAAMRKRIASATAANARRAGFKAGKSL